MTTESTATSRFQPNLLTDPRLNYAKFINAVWQEASHTAVSQSGNKYGLLNFITSDAEWNALPGNKTLDNAGNEVFARRYDIIQDVPQPALTVSANAYKSYETLRDHQNFLREKLDKFTLKIAASIPVVDIAALRDPISGDIFITAAQYLQRVSAYKELTTEDLHRVDQKLHQQKKAGEDLTVIIERHLDCHSIRAVAGQALNEFDKVERFSNAISADPACAAATLSFRQMTPIPRNQTFAALSDHVLVHAPNHVPTISSVGLSPAFSASSTQEIISLRTQLAAALAANSSITPPISKPPTSNSNKNNLKRAYCYHHGYGTHAGVKCRTMLANPTIFSPAKLQATDPNSVPGGKY
jgi:hypothetical protein